MRLHDSQISGNAYKVRLLLSQLGIGVDRIEYDVTRGETRTEAFLACINPNGRVPVLEISDGVCLPESNAILWYLAEETRFLPAERLRRAQALQWLFFEQYSHEPYIAVARFWLHTGMTPERERQLPAKMAGGYAALEVMERHLAERDWLVGERYSIADIALYAYTHVAGEGGFDLEQFRRVGRWLDRVAGQPGHIPITA